MKTSRNAMIAKIKIAQKELNIDDDSYRLMLSRLTGQTSCKSLDEKQLHTVLNELKAKGFKPQSRKHIMPNHKFTKSSMMGKVEALLTDLSLPWSYANGMAKNMFSVDRVEWLSHEHLHKLIAALQIYANRARRKK